jgi:hypothetical protein
MSMKYEDIVSSLHENSLKSDGVYFLTINTEQE